MLTQTNYIMKNFRYFSYRMEDIEIHDLDVFGVDQYINRFFLASCLEVVPYMIMKIANAYRTQSHHEWKKSDTMVLFIKNIRSFDRRTSLRVTMKMKTIIETDFDPTSTLSLYEPSLQHLLVEFQESLSAEEKTVVLAGLVRLYDINYAMNIRNLNLKDPVDKYDDLRAELTVYENAFYVIM